MVEPTLTLNNPLGDYFDHLLAADGEVRGQHVNWDDLLAEAVSPYNLQDALNSSTLRRGFEPLCIQAPASGNDAVRRTHLFCLLQFARTMPLPRVRMSIMDSARRCLGGSRG
ncbi:hypothetical protein ACQUQU_11165 [Thalassolituus sp. LLYu03]|uniref:hypothetical protein n=1 Tax=Thalassolituus sp. LLYu03 TaxID=3421656 RepID=UPI003D265F2C